VLAANGHSRQHGRVKRTIAGLVGVAWPVWGGTRQCGGRWLGLSGRRLDWSSIRPSWGCVGGQVGRVGTRCVVEEGIAADV
jgi:hypothetical protein